MGRPNRRTLAAFLAITAFGLVVGCIWPTPWRYDHACEKLIRVNRLTQSVDVLDNDGWSRLTTNPFDVLSRRIDGQDICPTRR